MLESGGFVSGFALGFALDLLVALLIVRGIYFPSRRDKEYVLTFFAFNTSIYLVSSLLNEGNLSVGFGFGLFAIFSVLRYRTDPIPVREMTYLFILMALPVVDAVLIGQGQWTEVLLANAIIIGVFYGVERAWGFRYEARKSITYERIELIRPQQRERLLEDLRQRTGLEVIRCEVGRIDFLHDVAELKIYYREEERGDERVGVGAQRISRTIRG